MNWLGFTILPDASKCCILLLQGTSNTSIPYDWLPRQALHQFFWHSDGDNRNVNSNEVFDLFQLFYTVWTVSRLTYFHRWKINQSTCMMFLIKLLAIQKRKLFPRAIVSWHRWDLLICLISHWAWVFVLYQTFLLGRVKAWLLLIWEESCSSENIKLMCSNRCFPWCIPLWSLLLR